MLQLPVVIVLLFGRTRRIALRLLTVTTATTGSRGATAAPQMTQLSLELPPVSLPLDQLGNTLGADQALEQRAQEQVGTGTEQVTQLRRQITAQ